VYRHPPAPFPRSEKIGEGDMCKRPPSPQKKSRRESFSPILSERRDPRGGGGEVLLGILGKGLPPSSPNPDPISDQNM